MAQRLPTDMGKEGEPGASLAQSQQEKGCITQPAVEPAGGDGAASQSGDGGLGKDIDAQAMNITKDEECDGSRGMRAKLVARTRILSGEDKAGIGKDKNPVAEGGIERMAEDTESGNGGLPLGVIESHSKKRRVGQENVGGSAICHHGKRKDYCLGCGGSQICNHGKRKERCKDCGGSALCEHGKRKDYCKQCSCVHGKPKSECKECCCMARCPHGKQKRYCKECGGSALCVHGKRKDRCKECGGSALCQHLTRSEYCKECGGSALCQHGKRKDRCQECAGSAPCKHGKPKRDCKECEDIVVKRGGKATKAIVTAKAAAQEKSDPKLKPNSGPDS